MSSRETGAGPSHTSASGKASHRNRKGKGKLAGNNNTSTSASEFTTEQMALYKAMRKQLEARKKAAVAVKDDGMSSI